jgi:hypothetical protein
MKRSGTFGDGHGTVRNGHSNFHANGQETVYAERSGTPRNVRVGTQ